MSYTPRFPQTPQEVFDGYISRELSVIGQFGGGESSDVICALRLWAGDYAEKYGLLDRYDWSAYDYLFMEYL